MVASHKPGIVLGIHGLANKPPVDEKRRWWEAAIREGLKRNGHGTETAAEFAFIYWADLRYERPLGPDENNEPYEPDSGTGPFPRRTEAEPQLTTQVLSTLYRGVDWLEAKTGVTTVDDLILEYRFDDLWHYHSQEAFTRKVRGRVRDELLRHADQRILLVAHSMGSIIAYDCLRLLEREWPSLKVAHFVTMGSPLGLGDVKLKVASEHGAARVPNNVERWTNFADQRDLAAVAGALSDDYPPNDYGVTVTDVLVVNSYLRPNGEPNPHKSYGYLRTPEFSAIVEDFAPAPRRVVAATA
ncbi:lipase/acyltransferase domain-containing protein [Methylobacterium iners]|uniref:Lecithin:cholesterol acyltransferase n=1 Tax=Methylobacterium iners TaxID=418707 RepID=A0ABQ4S374_9HYPH|nr:hypothetical protein [Methylobacterium iners]GJD96222.1 hypothetical protein OCOJLMKI_3441 [Methylobacterium iners]